MRPARKGPENWDGSGEVVGLPEGFNEAGPQGAGKLDAGEAAALVGRLASMRPARKGPENLPVPFADVTTVRGLQ